MLNYRSDFKNNIGFNYLDFQKFSHLTKDLPFVMNWDSAKVQLSSNRGSYQKVYLFFSVHVYSYCIEFKFYGRSRFKKELFEIMKKNIESII